MPFRIPNLVRVMARVMVRLGYFLWPRWKIKTLVSVIMCCNFSVWDCSSLFWRLFSMRPSLQSSCRRGFQRKAKKDTHVKLIRLWQSICGGIGELKQVQTNQSNGRSPNSQLWQKKYSGQFTEQFQTIRKTTAPQQGCVTFFNICSLSLKILKRCS